MMQALFGKQPTPQELVKKWTREIRRQEREMEREIRTIEREEVKVKRSIKEAAKRKDESSVKVLAREVLHARHAKTRIRKGKAQLHSISNTLTIMAGEVKVVGHLQKTTGLMKQMNTLLNYPAIAGAAREMSQEMTKAGIIEEMVNDGMEEALSDEELSDEAEEEVQKVIDEITAGTILKAGAVPVSSLPVKETAGEEEEEIGESSDMRARLAGLKS